MHQDKNNKIENEKQPIQTKNWDFSQLTLKIGLVGNEQQTYIRDLILTSNIIKKSIA